MNCIDKKNLQHTATNLNNLAGLYHAQGKYEKAEPLYLQAIEILKQSLGEEHPNTQAVIKNYQVFLNEKNNQKPVYYKMNLVTNIILSFPLHFPF